MPSNIRFFSRYLTLYVTKEILPGFLAGTVIFLFIMLMFQAIRLSEFVVVHQVRVLDVARLSAFMMASFLPIAIPIAFLFAVLMGISRANSEGEILALQVTGFSLGQIFFPIFAFSGFVSLLCLYLALYTVPGGNRAFELLITKLSGERVMASLKPGVFQEGFHGLVLLAEQIIPLKNELKNIFIFDDREESYPLAITAQAGLLRNDLEKGVLTLRLTDGAIYVDRKNIQESQQKIGFDIYDINLDLPESVRSWRDYSPPSYAYPQLKARLSETQSDPIQNRKLLVEYHRRFSLSFACMVFAGLGMFGGVQSQRGVRSTAIIICMLVGLVYWLSYLGANAAAIVGSVPPGLAIWSPNIVFGFVAYYYYRRYHKG